MKLNYKRTILVGFAFFLISAFWQAYDNAIPLTLTNKFGMSQTWSGVIMALDNILAVILLPLFGALSDKHKGKHGRRTPFIVVGTVLAAVAFVALSFVDNVQLKNLSNVSRLDDPAALTQIYESQSDNTLLTPEGDAFVLADTFTAEQFAAYLGIVPGEHSSAEGRNRLGITKAGNAHVRTLLTEAAQSFGRGKVGYKSKALAKRQEGNPTRVIAYADRANERLRRKYYRLIAHGKQSNVAKTAVARELGCFMWGMMTGHIN